MRVKPGTSPEQIAQMEAALRKRMQEGRRPSQPSGGGPRSGPDTPNFFPKPEGPRSGPDTPNFFPRPGGPRSGPDTPNFFGVSGSGRNFNYSTADEALARARQEATMRASDQAAAQARGQQGASTLDRYTQLLNSLNASRGARAGTIRRR